jgi:tRNA(Ile)-lysidine synthetase, N-terminal domain/tRNA(Ile)-lysidine synthetase, C-terminal domain
MLSKVADFIEKHDLLSKEDLHIVAVSGGADSVALLLVLKQLGYRVEAAHCNFQLRSDESNRDEMFVQNLCKENDVPLHIIHFDTKFYAETHQVSIEMSARELRYRYFEQLRQDIGAADISVAHHRDDAVETLLMNLLRGTGIHGLTGIRPHNGHIVRPLLGVNRKEIEEFLDSIGQSYVTDSTNLVDDVVRNKLRLNVLPQMKMINPKAADGIYRTAQRMAEAEKVFDAAIQSAKKRVSMSDGSIEISALKQEPSPEYLLFEMLTPLGFSPDSIEQIATCLDGPTGRYFSSETHELVFDRGRLIIQERQTTQSDLRIPEPGTYIYGQQRLRIEQQEGAQISKDAAVATLDAALVAFPLILRPVCEGDRFVPFGMTESRLVSDYLTDIKVNLLDKRRQLVVCDAKEAIVWLVGRRTDNRFRISNDTKTTLRIVIDRGNA